MEHPAHGDTAVETPIEPAPIVRKAEPASVAETAQMARNLVINDRAVALFGFCGGSSARAVVVRRRRRTRLSDNCLLENV